MHKKTITFKPRNPNKQGLQKKRKFIIYIYTGLLTKNETSETIVRNLFSPFSCSQGSLEAKLDQIIK